MWGKGRQCRVCVHMCMCVHVCVHARMCVHGCAHMRVHVLVCVCVHGKEGAPETERSYEGIRKIGFNQAYRRYRADRTLYLLLHFLGSMRRCWAVLDLIEQRAIAFTCYLPNIFFFLSNCLKPLKGVVLCSLGLYISPHPQTWAKMGKSHCTDDKRQDVSKDFLRSGEWAQQKASWFSGETSFVSSSHWTTGFQKPNPCTFPRQLVPQRSQRSQN